MASTRLPETTQPKSNSLCFLPRSTVYMRPSSVGTDFTAVSIFRRPVTQAALETPRGRSRSNSSRSSTGSTGSPPGTLSQRRSVSSMKGLMPLRLSSSCSSLTSGTPSDERMGAETGTYFPEQLVRDLEMSSAMFAAKNLTAGVPLSSSFVDDKGRMRASLFPYKRAPSPGFHSGSHIPSLGPIEERESMVSFLNQHQYQEESTDTDSLSDTDLSVPGAVVAPSVPFREQSVVTAATSLASAGNIPSPQDSLPPCDTSRVYSWIEGDSDMEDNDFTAEDKAGFLSPRPPTPPESDNSISAVTGPGGMHHAMRTKRSLHRRSQSLAINVPGKLPQRRLSGRSAKAKLQSTPHKAAWADFHDSPTTFGGPAWKSIQTSPPAHAVMQTPLPDTMEYDGMSSLASLVAVTSPQVGHHLDDDDEDSLYPTNYPVGGLRSEVYIRPSPPPSPPPTVQHLLAGGVQPCSPPTPIDDGPRAVPLPPDVVETLRVSVTCFPETMLLTSSLTLETIRAYAKKVRHPHLLGSAKALLESPSTTRLNAGKAIWRKVSSYRPGGRSQKDDACEMDVAPEPLKPWMAVKNIFRGASDYICDALYAHIVAYNYVSALVPAYQHAPRNCISPSPSTRGDIPRKAASLLGLSQRASINDRPSTASYGQLSSWRRSSRSSSQLSSPTYPYQESALRDVQAGLMRCVMGLVATARTMAEEEGKGIGKGVVVLEGRATDEFLMKSLLEVVRLSEEMS